MPHETTRHLEIDALRTAAIAMMVCYHTAYDLQFLFAWPIDVQSGWWLVLRQSTAILFLLLVGMSAVVMAQHSPKRRFVKRGCIVLGCAMLITAITALVFPTMYVRFGILHMIGVSMLVLPIFLPLGRWNALVGIVIVVLGTVIDGTQASTSLLLPLGIVPHHFATLDYYPLLPWFGVVLLGVAIGHLFYVLKVIPNAARAWIDQLGTTRWIRIIVEPGKHSLLIYLVHQPMILLILKQIATRYPLPAL